MTALVKNMSLSDTRDLAPVSTSAYRGGFAMTRHNAGRPNEFTRVVLTILLVLYPAMASVGLVLAAMMMSGATI